MKVIGFFGIWVLLAAAVFAIAFFRTRHANKPSGYARAPKPARLLVGVVGLAVLVVLPFAVVTAASDRVPSGAGTYTVDSNTDLREGREIFISTCASCHTLAAADARGVTGPNLDQRLPNKASVEAAIKNGGSGQDLMPAGLLEGNDAKLVSQYVAEVAGDTGQ